MKKAYIFLITDLYFINFGLIFHLHSVPYIMPHNMQVNIVSYWDGP